MRVPLFNRVTACIRVRFFAVLVLLIIVSLTSAETPNLVSVGGSHVSNKAALASSDEKVTKYTLTYMTDGNGTVQFQTPTTQFASVEGTEFYLNGKPFRFSGTNAYYLWYGAFEASAAQTNQGCVPDVLDAAQDLNLKVIRTWGFGNQVSKYGYCFQPEAGVYDEATFAHFDRVIKEASDRGLMLIVTFVNNWSDFGGMSTYNNWCGVSDHDEFYTNEQVRTLYKSYVSYFLNRTNTLTGVAYKDDPTIFAWELANEPRCRFDKTGAVLNAWIGEMSEFVKSIDSNHLVTTGVDGGYIDKGSNQYAWWYKGNEGQDYYGNHTWEDIDFATFHYYRDMDSSINAETWIREHIEDAHNIIGKPVLFEEFGSTSDKLTKYTVWYGIMEELGCNGDSFWMLADETFLGNDDGYFLALSDPNQTDILDLIRTHATGMSESPVVGISQLVSQGDDGTAVKAIPEPGYVFIRWSDDSTDNPRTDINVANNISVMAIFEYHGSAVWMVY